MKPLAQKNKNDDRKQGRNLIVPEHLRHNFITIVRFLYHTIKLYGILVIETQSKSKNKKKQYISKPINTRTIDQGVKSDIIGLILFHWMLLVYNTKYRYIYICIEKEKEKEEQKERRY